MKSSLYVLALSLLLIPATTFAQSSNFQDGFEDGDFTNNPTWSGDTGQFAIIEGPPNHLLQLQGDAQDGDISYLSTPSSNVTGSWEFYIELDFSPSGENKTDIFLMSDIADLEGSVNGYALRAGESGSSDVFRIVRYDVGSEAATVLSGTTDISSGGAFRVRVTRQAGGDWTLEVAGGYDGQLTREGGTQTDNTYSSSSYFGVRTTYSSSRANLFYFDFKIDLPPFTTTGTQLTSINTIDVGFNRAIEQGSVSASDFSVNNGFGSPSSVRFPTADTVRLDFGEAISSNRYTISVSGVTDQSGNTVQTGTSESVIVFGSYAVGDVLVNEFVYDPPGRQAEYVELINTSGKYLNLANWKLGDISGTNSFGADPVVLAADSFLVVSADTSVLSTVHGARAYFELDQLAAFNNGGDAVQLTTSSGSIADSLTYTSDWGGSDVALERRSLATPSIYPENWGNSPNTDGGTPGLPNEVPDDTSPPSLSGYEISDNQTILLFFDERVGSSSADNASNYDLNPGITISSVQVLESDTVQLALNAPLQNATDYTLTTSAVEDIFGNAITSKELNFTHYEISQADSGDLFVNEFMYDPPGNGTEFVELYNPTEKSLNLQNWTLNDNARIPQPITTSRFVLPPDSSVVIAPDSSLVGNSPAFSLVVMDSDFPSLNNGGDDIVIRRADGALLDSLSYESSWGGNEVALERRTTSVSAIYPENWGDAPENSGSPGSDNTVSQDQTAPAVAGYEIISDSELRIIFDERITSSSATTTENYQFSGGTSIASANVAEPDTVNLQLQSALQNATNYQLTVGGMEDIFGNTLSSQSIFFTYYEISEADSGDVFVNEFIYDPPEGMSEFVELHNPTSESFDLQGWTLNDNTGNRRTMTSSRFVVPPDSFVVIAPDSTLISTFPDLNLLTIGSRFAPLNNSGDDIILRRADGTLLDSLRFSSTWGGDRGSLERRTTAVSSSYRENWSDSPASKGATPGSANQVTADQSAPTFEALEILDGQTLNLLFSERIDPSSATTLSNYDLSGSAGISGVSFLAPDTVQLSLDASLQNAGTYTLSASNLEDIFGNASGTLQSDFSYYEISAADSGDVFVNEFIYDPGDGLTEFVELRNTTSASFDLQGWTLNDNTGNRRTITSSQFVVPPDSFVVIAPDSTLLHSFPDFSLVVMGNGFPSLNNSTDDIVIRRANGLQLDSLRYSTAWGGNVISLERRTTSVSGIYRENWGDSPTGTATPGRANQVSGADSSPPSLRSVEILDNRTLQVLFSETVTTGPAKTLGNYSMDEGISIAEAAVFKPDTVQLNLDSDLQNATEYSLSVSGLEDVFGNTMTSQQINFVYYEVSNADSADLLVNEFMFDPAEGETEYIELHNPTEKSFDLRGWTLNDNTGNRRIITSSQFIVPPDSFAVIAPDSTLIERYPDLNLVTIGGRFPSLNNSGDDVVIRQPDGVLMDSVRFNSSWGGNEVSLERKTTSVAAVFQENWGDPTNGTGTPGRPNSIEPDETPPELVSVDFLNASAIQLAFSETISPQSATAPSNYAITPSLDIQLISAAQDTVTLFLASDLVSGTTYEITASNLQDIFGNATGAISRSREYLLFSHAKPGDVMINEVLYERAGATGPEFVELYNRSSRNFDLRGWQLGDGSDLININGNIQLEANSYLYLTGNKGFASTKSNGYHLEDFPSLNDDEDAVYIRSERQVTIDSLYYYARWGGSEGTSIERKDPSAASNDASNWITSQSQGGISAGNNNGSFSPDDTPPEVIFSTRRPDGLIEVRFNEFIQLTKDLSFSLGGAQLQVQAFDSTQGNQILLQEPSSKRKAKSLNITIQNLTDVKGNSRSSASIAVAEPVEPGSVVINEIMYNPLSESDDNQPDQSEYLELRNTRDYAISLEGFVLHDAADENGETRSLVPVSSASKFLPGNGHLLVYAEDQTTTFAESQTAVFFELSGLNPNRTVQINRGSLSLASRDDAIYLADSTGATIDSVFYDQSWHNPNIVDTRGVALERINPGGPSGEASNWSSSTTEKGGTPGTENSIFQVPQDQPQEIGINFNPNPFSPDGDGREDNLFINYKLDQPDYLLKVRIYDRYGRLVRELADGKQAGFEGTLQWDGTTDEGNRNRIGIYIVLFEAYNSSEGSDRTFKKTVVLARQL